MATETVLAPASVNQACNLLDQIVTSADAADRRALHMHPDGHREELELYADDMRTTICTLGWIAERALCELGADDVLCRKGLAENWLLWPGCRAAGALPSTDDARTELRHGAEAFLALMADIKTQCDKPAFREPGDVDGSYNTRDFVSMGASVRVALRNNLLDAAGYRAEGFLIALTDLLAMAADGVTPGDGWDPLANTRSAHDGGRHD